MASISFRKCSLLKGTLALLCSAAMHGALGQVVPTMYAKPDLSAFATVTGNVTPDFRYFGTPAVLGYTLGGFLQIHSIFGVELRGSIQRRLNAEHHESILAGPRFALHHGRFSPYVATLGGAGNGWRYKDPPVVGVKPPKPVEGLGPQWTVLGGVDYHFNHHFAARLGEASYSTIYLKNWNLTPLNLSAGIIFRVN